VTEEIAGTGMQTLVETVAFYGPAAIFVGTFLEGETIVVVAGFLAHQGVLNPFVVAIAAFLGSCFGDQLWFYLGRRHATHPFVLRVTRRPLFQKIMSAIEDHPKKFILTFRFIYGIRTISPVAIGLADISGRVFLVFNALSAVVWAAAFTTLGYLSGQAVEALLGDIKAIEHKLLAAAGIALAVFGLVHLARYLRHRFANRRPDTEIPDGRDPG